MKDSQYVSAITSPDAKKSNDSASTALGAFEQRLKDKANGNKEDGGAKIQVLEQVNEETNSQYATTHTKKVPELIASEEDLPKPPGASTAAFDESIEKKNSQYVTKKAPEMIASEEDLPKPPGAYEEVGAVKFNEKMGGLELIEDNEGPSLSHASAFDDSIEKKNSQYATKKAPQLIGSEEDLPKPPGAYEEVGAVKFNEKMG